MSGLGYNICATPQMIEIIHLSGVTAGARGPSRDEQATKTGTSGRQATARRREEESPSGLGEGHEKGAELHGLEAVRNLTVLPRPGDLDHPETRLAAPAFPEIYLAGPAA